MRILITFVVGVIGAVIIVVTVIICVIGIIITVIIAIIVIGSTVSGGSWGTTCGK